MELNLRTVKNFFIYIFLAELVSLCGYLVPEINTISFLFLILLAFFLIIKKFEYGVYLLVAELFIGSKGYLFSFDYLGINLSIRIAFWLIVMSFWLGIFIIQYIRKKISFSDIKKYIFELKYFFILFLFIFIGLINGFANNIFENVFYDFNAWLYLTLCFPLSYVLISKEKSFKDKEKYLSNIVQIFYASIIWLSFKTLFLLFAFSHNLIGMIDELYHWVRDTGVGEITRNFDLGNFHRIFFQSHIFVLIGLFPILLILLKIFDEYKIKSILKKKIFWIYFSILTLLLSVNLVNFSRSNWLGLAFGLLLIFILEIKKSYKNIFNYIFLLASSTVISIILITIIIVVPIPGAGGGKFSTDFLTQRATQITNEAGASSRWNLLPKLWEEIRLNPIIGKGFGATVTYISNDPRVRKIDSTGSYTTYAFEWGWQDIWLKIGILGLLSYLILIFDLIYKQYKNLNNDIWLSVGLISLMIVNIFSPYFNHPLGIGFVILVYIFTYKEKLIKI